MPRYQEIADVLRLRMEQRIYGEGQRLPGERVLTAEFGVQRSTLRRALEVLSDQGLIERDAQRGTFVAGRKRAVEGRLALCIGRPGDTDAPGRIAQGVVTELTQAHTSIEIEWFDRSLRTGQIESATPTPEEAREKRLAGVLVYPQRRGESDRIRELAQVVPVVLLDTRLPGLDVDFVGFDDYQGGRAAARCLHEAGHHRIAFFGSIQTEPGADRLAGVSDYLSEQRLVPLWKFAQTGGALEHFSPEMLRALFADDPEGRPTAAVCSNDQTALKVVHGLQRIGLRMPEDLALVGFGNSQPEFLDALGLSSMAQPYEEVGRAAARLLLARVAGETPRSPTVLRLPLRLVTRRSCVAR